MRKFNVVTAQKYEARYVVEAENEEEANDMALTQELDDPVESILVDEWVIDVTESLGGE